MKRKKIYAELIRLVNIGERAIKKAQENNKKKGIPNVYSRNKKIFYELPDGTITTTVSKGF